MGREFDLYLITGATGFLGKVIVNRLLEKGKRVRALVLPNDPATGDLPKGVELVCDRVDDRTSLAEFFKGDLKEACLIHGAGIISIATRKNPKLRAVNVEGTKNIMEMCLEHGVAKVVHISSVHAIPEKPRGQIMREIRNFSEKTVIGSYAKSKAAGTNAVFSAIERGLNACIVHPSGIIGPYDTGSGNVTSTVISFCKKKLPIAVKGGYDFVDVRDVADGIISCSENGEKGECYILSGQYAKLSDILGYLSRIGCGREPMYLPLWLVKCIAPFLEWHCVLHKKPLFLTPYSAYTLGSNAYFSHEKATAAWGYKPRSLFETLDDMVHWLAKNRMIPHREEKK
ncbi:MAG: NAD-dependent epimerase/dehydratase family protein [Christensenellales bacterium]|jgi:dihydroflavonol-4-reductase